MKRIRASIVILALFVPGLAFAQQTLSLDECRRMAVSNNKSLQQSRTEVTMAGYDRKTALANYFPNISATGAYMYTGQDIALVSDDVSAQLRGAGTALQTGLSAKMEGLTNAIMSNPQAAMEYMKSPMWQTVLGALSQTDLSQAINGIGAQLDDALHLDTENIMVGAVTLTQPLFMGGKIVAANRIATLAEELARTKYDTAWQQVMVDVDQAYWQIVSIAAKKELAENYSDLLHQMEKDMDVMVQTGVATPSDALSIKVKANEAEMLKTRAEGGLRLAKMLLCKQIGLDLDSDIVLEDELADTIPAPQLGPEKSMDAIYADRSELRSLQLASDIYDKKVNVARADMLPSVALTASYLVTNPNLKNGFQNEFGGMFSAGVLVKVPIFHGFEAMQKTRKAKAEADLYRLRYEDTRDLVNLQVSQLRTQMDASMKNLAMAESNLDSAEENLRTAMVGFEEGVVESNTALAAQTAWLQAHSEYIDAGIELQMTKSNLMKAEGDYKVEE